MTNPVALQLYTLREEIAADRAGTLRRVAEAGYRAVEPFGGLLDDADGLHAELDANGLDVCSVHGLPAGDGAEAIWRGAAAIGAGTVIVPHIAPERYRDADGVAAVAAELNDLAQEAHRRGLRLGYHNHDFELSTQVDGRPALEALAAQLDDEVLLEVDTYWAAVGGQDVVALLRRLGDRVRYLHIKDGPVTRDDPMTAVGAGRIPIAEIMAASASVEWHVVELDWCAGDMMRAVSDSHRWLTEHDLAGSARADR